MMDFKGINARHGHSFGDLMKATGGKAMNLVYPTDRPLVEQKITADLANGQVQSFFC